MSLFISETRGVSHTAFLHAHVFLVVRVQTEHRLEPTANCSAFSRGHKSSAPEELSAGGCESPDSAAPRPLQASARFVSGGVSVAPTAAT